MTCLVIEVRRTQRKRVPLNKPVSRVNIFQDENIYIEMCVDITTFVKVIFWINKNINDKIRKNHYHISTMP